MVAILGPSGSGKTSLLNALSQRLGLSSGSFVKGQIKINDKVLEKEITEWLEHLFNKMMYSKRLIPQLNFWNSQQKYEPISVKI